MLRKTLTGIRDVDRLILSILDDRSLLEIMKTNRFFLKEGEETFERKLRYKYPFLYKKKPFFEKWSKYYLSNDYYMNILKNKHFYDKLFNEKILEISTFNPIALCRALDSSNELRGFGFLAQCYAETGDKAEILNFCKSMIDELPYIVEDIMEDMEDMIAYIEDTVLSSLLKFDNIELYEELKKNWNVDFLCFTYQIGQSRNIKIVEYALTQIPYDINEEGSNIDYVEAIMGAASIGDVEMINFLSEKFNSNVDLKTLFIGAILGGQKDFIKNLISNNAEYIIKNNKRFCKFACFRRTWFCKMLIKALRKFMLGSDFDFLTYNAANEMVIFVIDLCKELGSSKKKIVKWLVKGKKNKNKNKRRFLKKVDRNFIQYLKKFLF